MRPATRTAAERHSRLAMTLPGSLTIHAGIIVVLVLANITGRLRPQDLREAKTVELVFAPPAPEPASVAPAPASPAIPEAPEAPNPATELTVLSPPPPEVTSPAVSLTVPPPPTEPAVPLAPPAPPSPPAVLSSPPPTAMQLSSPQKQPLPRRPSRPPSAVPSAAPARPAPAETAASSSTSHSAPQDVISVGWRSAVGAWLQAHKTYPEQARRRGEEGRAVVRFTVSRDGRVSQMEFLSGTKSAALDEAIDRLLHDARLPPFPPEMSQAEVTVTLQIRYSLER